MDASELREKTVEQLREELVSLKKAQFNMRFQQAGGQMESTAEMRKVRRGVARTLTVINEKIRNAASSATAEDASA